MFFNDYCEHIFIMSLEDNNQSYRQDNYDNTRSGITLALHSQSIEVKLPGVEAKSKSSLLADTNNMKSPIYYI
jgi:hypothetical protein